MSSYPQIVATKAQTAATADAGKVRVGGQGPIFR